MKKFLFALLTVITLGLSVGTASAHSSQYWICNTPSLKAVWAYPTGSYWAAQLSRYPTYYAAHDASYVARYGC